MVPFLRGASLSIAMVMVLVNCGGGPVQPPPPPTVTLSSLTVSAPSTSIGVGQTLNFSATAVRSDGTTQTVTTQSSWVSTNTGVATVAGGVVTAVGPGEADIRATFQTVSGSARLTVTAAVPNAFTLCGTVREGGTNTVISDAEVEIRSGPDTDRKTSTNDAGAYCFTGVRAATITVRAFKSGFDVQDQNVTVSSNTTLDFSLQRATVTPTLIARPGGPYGPVNSGNPGIELNGLASTSTPFPIAHYFWTCGQAGNSNCNQDSPTPRFVYTKTGSLGTTVSYTVTLIIEDTQGNRSSPATTTVTVTQVY